MIEINAQHYRGTKAYPLPIGRLGENLVRKVIFSLEPLRELYGPEGEWSIVAQRPNEKFAYISTSVAEEDNNACWTITKNDVGLVGFGRVELRYYPKELPTGVYKSIAWYTFIEDAIGENYGEGSPYDDILESVRESASEAAKSAEKAEQAVIEAKKVTVEITKAEYEALSEAQKLDGTVYLVTDEDPIAKETVEAYLDDNKYCRLFVKPEVSIAHLLFNKDVDIDPKKIGYFNLATIPEAYRPKYDGEFLAYQTKGKGKAICCEVNKDGSVRIYCENTELIGSPIGSYVYFY